MFDVAAALVHATYRATSSLMTCLDDHMCSCVATDVVGRGSLAFAPLTASTGSWSPFDCYTIEHGGTAVGASSCSLELPVDLAWFTLVSHWPSLVASASPRTLGGLSSA